MGLPRKALDQHTAIVGKTGSGKTYMAKGEVERLLEREARVCIVDPTGVWWGLRSNASGTKPAFTVVVFGGDHADVPIKKTDGAAVAQLIANRYVPCVIDLSEFSLSGQKKFMTDFAQRLYDLNKAPLHLVLDEADEFAPQQPLPDSKVLSGAIDRIVRRGRVKGFRVMLITQRPAVLHKSVLAQCNSLVAMRLVAPQDRNAIKAWIEGQADVDKGREVLDSLPSLGMGEGWVWAPEQNILERQKFPQITTYDSSRTPKEGDEDLPKIVVEEIDVDDFRNFLSLEDEEEVKTPPRRVRKSDILLRKQLKQKDTTISNLRAEKQQFQELYKSVQAENKDLKLKVRQLSKNINLAVSQTKKIEDDAQRLRALIEEKMECAGDNEAKVDKPLPVARSSTIAMVDPPSELAPRELRVIGALQTWEFQIGVADPTRKQVAWLSDYSPSSSSFRNMLSGLKTAGYISYPRTGSIALTDQGRELKLSEQPLICSSEELQELIFSNLQPREQRVMCVLVDCYPYQIERGDLANKTGYSIDSSSYRNMLSGLRSLGLLDYSEPGYVKAQSVLFLPEDQV